MGDLDPNVDKQNLSTRDLIASLKTAFRATDFAEVESILASREKTLKEKAEIHNLDKLENIKIWKNLQNDLNSLRKEYLDLKESLPRSLQQPASDEDDKKLIIMLKRENCDLACRVMRAESKCQELKEENLRLRRELRDSKRDENFQCENQGSSEGIDDDAGVKAGVGNASNNISFTGTMRSPQEQVVILDDDDETDECGILDSKEPITAVCAVDPNFVQLVTEDGAGQPRRRKALSASDAIGNDAVASELSVQNSKKKMKGKKLDLPTDGLIDSHPEAACTTAYGGSEDSAHRRETQVVPGHCKEKMNKVESTHDQLIEAAKHVSDGSVSKGSSSLSDSDEDLDYTFDFSSIIRNNRTKEDHKTWEVEADMIAAFENDQELCLKALCVLYRQQISESLCCGSSGSQNRAFDKHDATRGTDLAKFLIDGDPQVKLKKSATDLAAYDESALDDCRKIVTRHSKQLFEIYKLKEDSMFLN